MRQRGSDRPLAGQPDKIAAVEASVKSKANGERKLDSEKARRIVAAMRSSVARQGVTKSTFDHVAQQAGVSRGLLHYYFGSKERLLVEVVRHDTDLRIAQLEERLAGAHSTDDVVDALLSQLELWLGDDPEAQALLYEMLSVSRRSDDVREQLAELYRRWRAALAAGLREKQDEGAVTLRGDPDAVASVIFSLGDGLIMQALADRDWDPSPAVAMGVGVVRRLLGGE
jgi:AcrR family transcriptional regulator